MAAYERYTFPFMRIEWPLFKNEDINIETRLADMAKHIKDGGRLTPRKKDQLVRTLQAAALVIGDLRWKLHE